MEKNNIPVYFTIPEAAEYLKSTELSIRKMIAKEIFPAYRISERKTLICLDDIEKYIKDCRISTCGKEKK